MSGNDDYTFSCDVRLDRAGEKWIGVADGTQETVARDQGMFTEQRDKLFFIPRSLIRDCDPPLDALPASGPRMVNLTIPEWKAKQEGII